MRLGVRFGLLVSFVAGFALLGPVLAQNAPGKAKAAAPVRRAAPAPVQQAPDPAAVAGAKALADLGAAEPDNAKAVKYYDAAIMLTPRDADLYVRRGAEQALLGHPDLAIADYDRALALDPQLPLAWLYRAYAHTNQAEWAASLADAEAGLRIAPDDPKLLHQWQNSTQGARYTALPQATRDISVAMFKAETAGDFAEMLRLALSLNEAAPDYPRAYVDRGRAQRFLKQTDAALANFDAALKLDPRLADAWNQRGMALVSLGDNLEALIAFNRAATLDPSSAIFIDNRGTIYLRLNDYASATADLENAARLDPKIGNANDLAIARSKRDAAIAAAMPAPVARPATVAAGGRSCHDLISGFASAVAAGDPFTRTGWEASFGLAQMWEQHIWGMREYIRLNDALPACRQDREDRQIMVDTVNGAMTSCNQARGRYCTDGAHYGSSSALQTERDAFDRYVAENSATAPPSPEDAARSANAAAGERACYAQTEAIRKQVDAANRRAGSSAVTSLEILMWGTRSAIDVIERTCPTAPSFVPMLASFRETNAQATKTCAQVSSTGGCVARLP